VGYNECKPGDVTDKDDGLGMVVGFILNLPDEEGQGHIEEAYVHS
jgi:hypothetical protein